MIHEFKCHTPFFEEVLAGRKTFEVRIDDREPRFEVGHILVLLDFDGAAVTGRRINAGPITYVLRDFYGLQKGWCVLGFPPVKVERDVPTPDREDLEQLRDRLRGQLATAPDHLRTHYRRSIEQVEAQLSAMDDDDPAVRALNCPHPAEAIDIGAPGKPAYCTQCRTEL